MAILYPEKISAVVKKEILKGLTFQNPTGGLQDFNSPSVPKLSSQIDQLSSRIPFKAVDAAQLQQPNISHSDTDLFVNTGLNENFPSPTGILESVDINFTDASDAAYTRTMSSIAGLLEISSSGLGVNALEEMLTEFQLGLTQILSRYLSVALIYGGYYPTPAANWFYYQTIASPANGWNQAVAFDGLYQITRSGADGGLEAGYLADALNAPITLAVVNTFISDFKGSNNGYIDYLVMNSDLRREYLNLWHGLGQVPQYITDPKTGKLCLAHDGIPILTNDYIMTYDGAVTQPVYIKSDDNPENVLGSPTIKQTSMYALCVGEQNGGIFGIYPKAFGAAPIKIERQTSSQLKDTIILKGTIQVGLGFRAHRAVGRLSGIVIA